MRKLMIMVPALILGALILGEGHCNAQAGGAAPAGAVQAPALKDPHVIPAGAHVAILALGGALLLNQSGILDGRHHYWRHRHRWEWDESWHSYRWGGRYDRSPDRGPAYRDGGYPGEDYAYSYGAVAVPHYAYGADEAPEYNRGPGEDSDYAYGPEYQDRHGADEGFGYRHGWGGAAGYRDGWTRSPEYNPERAEAPEYRMGW